LEHSDVKIPQGESAKKQGDAGGRVRRGGGKSIRKKCQNPSKFGPGHVSEKCDHEGGFVKRGAGEAGPNQNERLPSTLTIRSRGQPPLVKIRLTEQKEVLQKSITKATKRKTDLLA